MTEQELAEKLKALGTIWTTVAYNLHQAKIKGFRRNCYECPISNYVRSILGGDPVVSSDCFTIAVGEHVRDNEGNVDFCPTLIVDTPPGVASFICMFDAGIAMRFLVDRRDTVGS